MGKLYFHENAEQEPTAIGAYIAEDNLARAVTFLEELRKHCQWIADGPALYKLVPFAGEGVRQARFGNYLIFYSEIEGGVLIEHIIHARRDLPLLFGEESD